MSIIRLTLIKDRLYAPTGLGALVDTKYARSNGSRRGLLEVGVNPPHPDSPPESAVTPSPELCDYLQFKASNEAAESACAADNLWRKGVPRTALQPFTQGTCLVSSTGAAVL